MSLQIEHDDKPDNTNDGSCCRFPLITTLFVLTCGVGIAAMQIIGPSWDRAIANLGILIFGFLALMSMLGWFTFRSPFSTAVRVAPAVALVCGTGLFFVCFEFIGLSGTGVPRFRWRFSPAPDEVLADELPRREEETDLASASASDFSQFLGPRRDQKVEGVELRTDWQSEPPREIWRQPCGAGWSSFAAQNGFAITLEQRGPMEVVTCYEIATGTMQWWHAIDERHKSFEGGLGPYSTPTIHEGKVYALGGTGVLRCLNGTNGELIWQRNLLHEFGMADSEEDQEEVKWGRAASPLLVDDVVVVPAGGPPGGPYVSLVAYDKDDGEQKWTSGDQQISYSSPVLAIVAGVRQIVIVNEASISAHRVDGQGSQREVLWTHPWPGDSSVAANVSQPVIVQGDRVLLSKAYGQGATLLQIQKNDDGQFVASRIWRNESVLKTKHTSSVVHDGYVYALSDGILECVQLDSGQRQWKRGRYEHGQILLVGDVLLVQTESGELVLVEPNPRQLVELSRFEALDGQTWNNPCLSGRYLLVRNSEEAACYELPVGIVRRASEPVAEP